MSGVLHAAPCTVNHRFTAAMELNVSAGCSTLFGALFSAGCSTLLAGSRVSPLEVRKNARMTQYTAARSC
eukprot:3338021-Pyramimonas_sp.AAC.1